MCVAGGVDDEVLRGEAGGGGLQQSERWGWGEVWRARKAWGGGGGMHSRDGGAEGERQE